MIMVDPLYILHYNDDFMLNNDDFMLNMMILSYEMMIV